MVGKSRKFDAEFREGAVRIVAEAGKPIPQVAKDLGINVTTLATWVSRAGAAGKAGPTGESDELTRLRRENSQLKRDKSCTAVSYGMEPDWRTPPATVTTSGGWPPPNLSRTSGP